MTSEPKHIQIGQESGVTVLTITDSQLNEYDQSHELRDEIERAITAAKPPEIVIDMRNVEYLTSVALLPFVSVSSTAARLGGQVVLCNLADVVAKVLTVSQLLVEHRSSAQHLLLSTDLDSAVALLHKPGDSE